ncbi:hypothetical protein F4604DRAFT_1924509 [Suillus subluteus]|nr:hypothetical protein F4604DRAFT_1924509 [Suillus subluteus]
MSQMWTGSPAGSELPFESQSQHQPLLEEEDSTVLVERFMQELIDHKLFIPSKLSEFDMKKPETHAGHQAAYEGYLANFLQELLHILECACWKSGIPSKGNEFISSTNDCIETSSQKPDIVLTSKIKKGDNFGQVQAVIEVKYTQGTSHRKDALQAFTNRSWFMLDECDQRVHTIGGALCSSTFTPAMVDRRGFVCSEDFNIKKCPVSFLQCCTAMTIGTRRAAGYDQEWGAEATDPNIINMAPANITKILIATQEQPLNIHASKDGYDKESRSTHIPQPPPPPSAPPSINTRLFLGPGEHIAIKDCWPTVEAIPEGYILDRLGGDDLKKSPEFSHRKGIPTKVVDRFIRGEDPATGNDVVDSTVLHCRGSSPIPIYERRVHYCMVTEDVCIDLSWFSHKREFFSAILKAIKAHKFAVQDRNILHRDISPANIWLYIRKLETDLAIPSWEEDKPPPIRMALLGDWGMAAPLPNFEWEEPGGGIPVLVEKGPEVGFTGYNTSLCDRTGTLPFMATELLWDEWGDRGVHHKPQHDLEAFWWTIAWAVCNFIGPYQQMR